MRKALADDLVLMYLGFASSEEKGVLEQSLKDLEQKRASLQAEIAALERQGDGRDPGPAKAAGEGSPDGGPALRAATTRRVQKLQDQLAKLERQIDARERAVPLYREARQADGMIDELRAQRDHPAHTLLRKMYHERRAGVAAPDGGME